MRIGSLVFHNSKASQFVVGFSQFFSLYPVTGRHGLLPASTATDGKTTSVFTCFPHSLNRSNTNGARCRRAPEYEISKCQKSRISKPRHSLRQVTLQIPGGSFNSPLDGGRQTAKLPASGGSWGKVGSRVEP
jgi:hypothetical protein